MERWHAECNSLDSLHAIFPQKRRCWKPNGCGRLIWALLTVKEFFQFSFLTARNIYIPGVVGIPSAQLLYVLRGTEPKIWRRWVAHYSLHMRVLYWRFCKLTLLMIYIRGVEPNSGVINATGVWTRAGRCRRWRIDKVWCVYNHWVSCWHISKFPWLPRFEDWLPSFYEHNWQILKSNCM